MAAYESPFGDVLAPTLSIICESRGFKVLRQYLTVDGDYSSFCGNHESVADKDTVLLHRDLLHALIMPVVQLFQHAATLAHAALCSQKPEDLELAFRGDARDAFVWLQVFIGEEDQWCHTQGCPACVLGHTLNAESTIRAVIAAALLSADERGAEVSAEHSPAMDDIHHPSLPDFTPLLPSIEAAVANDEFWGLNFYEHFFSRAQRTLKGLHDLISQCGGLEVLVTSQPSSPVDELSDSTIAGSISSTAGSPPSYLSGGMSVRVATDSYLSEAAFCQDEMRLPRGYWAERQSLSEEQERNVLLQVVCDTWSTQQAKWIAQARQQPWLLEPESRLHMERCRTQGLGLGFDKGQGERRRSLTCP